MFETLNCQLDDRGVLTVTLTRPEVRNAFNAQLIHELQQVFSNPAFAVDVRVVVLRGEGKSFCAGADLNWMKASKGLGFEGNREDALRMARMFQAVYDCPAPVVAFTHGHALGGGAGLVAAADFALVNEDAKLGFTEVKLGIIPAVISPFVLEKIGAVHARRYFVSGEIFDGREAERIGLAQKAMPLAEMEDELTRFLTAFLSGGPQAAREAKRLAIEIRGRGPAEAADSTAEWIARIRESNEGQEGMDAFLNKRPAAWVPREEDGA
jgi:methylglutaconyl-CoA hydratase